MSVESVTGVPRALYNVDYRVDVETNDSRRIADEYLRRRRTSVLRIDPNDDLRHASTTTTPAGSTVQYQQTYRRTGIPVDDAIVAVTVDHRGAVSFVACGHATNVRVPATIPSLKEEEAIEEAVADTGVEYRERLVDSRTELVVFADDDDDEGARPRRRRIDPPTPRSSSTTRSAGEPSK